MLAPRRQLGNVAWLAVSLCSTSNAATSCNIHHSADCSPSMFDVVHPPRMKIPNNTTPKDTPKTHHRIRMIITPPRIIRSQIIISYMTKTRTDYAPRRPQSNKRATPTINSPTPPKNSHEPLPALSGSGKTSPGTAVSAGCSAAVVSSEDGNASPDAVSDETVVAVTSGDGV